MYDDLKGPEDHTDHELGFQPRSRVDGQEESPVRRLPDREVPLQTSGAVSLVDRWLDGEATVAAVRASQGGNDAVDLWTKIHDEAETLRSRTTPLYVHQRIMDSLPDDRYKSGHSWYKRSITMNPATLILSGIALLAIGAIVAQMVFK
jgi:hypothetical protein